VDVQLDLSLLNEKVIGAHALIIRSATQVTAELLELATDLLVVGRAGIGLDNVDVDAATRRGVMVVNAPQSNIVSAAEHTMALLLAQARNVPQADAALKAGRWERSRWEGVELLDKTLGIVGLGRIGKLVADRAKAFGMRLVAYDPFVSAERARHMGVELMPLDQLITEADFVTVHLPKNKETTGLINRDLLLKAKPSLRVINVARGGIVDEQALADAIREGIIAGAALDVFSVEPTTESPLFELDSVIVTPHLGASTREAQDKAGDTIADMVQLALAGEFVPFAVNVNAAEANETLRPYLPLAERLGRVFASMLGAAPSTLEVCCDGEIAGYDTRIVSLAALKGFFGLMSDETVTYVNAPQLAKDHGVEVRETNCGTAADFVNLITVRGDGRSISGAIVGRRGEQRIVLIDEHMFDVPPAANMLMVKNDDRPGVIGTVGTLLGNAGVNIADMDVGRALEPGTAVMLIAPTAVVPDGVIAALRSAPGIISVTTLAG
jgi:D-3-phosphoglycerate dehydrogenase